MLALFSIFIVLFSGGCHAKQKPLVNLAFISQRSAVVEKYPKIPHDEILQQIAGNRLYGELEQRYRRSLAALKTAVDGDCAKLVIIIITPEVGKYTTLSNTYGIPYIIHSCDALGIDCINLPADIAEKQNQDPSVAPDDGTWSKEGAAYLSTLLESAVARYNDYKSSKVFGAGKKPVTFGDLPPKNDEVIESDKNTQYHLTVNDQGLRMDHSLTFPKTKQTILLLGGTQLYSPFLDNDAIATTLLQKKMPGKEIVNAGNLNYTMDDYVSLYEEKARYTEPDLIFVCTNGDDILNFFFFQRNHYSRLTKIYDPSETELKFYNQLYN